MTLPAPRRSTDLLPPAYWWTPGENSLLLYRRYGWVATVTPERVRIAAEPPLYQEAYCPCRSLEQGRRYAEKILAVRHCFGSPARAAFRERLRTERARRLRPLEPAAPDEGDEMRLP